MRHSLFVFLTMFGLCFANPAFAQDDPPPADGTEAQADASEGDKTKEGKAKEGKAKEGKAKEGKAKEGKAKTKGKAKAKGGEAEEAKAPETDEEAVQTAVALLDAIKDGKWPLAVGLLLTLLVYLSNRFALKGMVSDKAIPWVAGGVGAAGATGMALMGGTEVGEALTLGVVAAVAAVGGWEAVMKYVTDAKAPEAETESSESESSESETESSE